MALNNINPIQTTTWKKLSKHFNETKGTHLKTLFSTDKNRATTFSVEWKEFLFDYSKNRIT